MNAEDVHVLLASNGAVISSSITGHMKLKVIMAGMPELRLILNDAERRMIHRSPPATYVTFSDVELHECVQRSRFAVDRTIAFVPPEGEVSGCGINRVCEAVTRMTRLCACVNFAVLGGSRGAPRKSCRPLCCR